MPFAGCTADVLHDPLRRRFRMHGFLSHLHSLMVTMSQKSFVPQAAKSVSQALMSDSSERPGVGTDMPPMRGCDAACPQAPASAAAVWAGRPLMRRLRIRRNRRTRARSPTTEVAPTDARRTNFPVSCRHSRTPIIRHGRPAKDKADLSSLRGAHEARQAIALARPQTPSDPAVSVHRLRACGHGRVARVRRRGALNELRDSLGAGAISRARTK